MTGPLDPTALAASLGALVRRHGALRTRFQAGADGPVQVVQDRAETPIRELRPREGLDHDRQLNAALAEPFDLGRAPLLRLAVLRRSAERHTLLLTVHHIICDGMSLQVLLAELGMAYCGGLAELGPASAGYLEFVTWQRREAAARLPAARDHWRRVLTPPPRPVDLAPDPLAGVDSYQPDRYWFQLGAGSGDRLDQASRSLRVTPFIALLAGFKAVLWRLSGQADLAIGSLFSGRVRAEFEATVGLLANATVLRTSLAGDPTFRELAGRVRAVVLDASDHQTVPIEQAAPVERLRPGWSVWFTMLPPGAGTLTLDRAAVRPLPLAPSMVVRTAPVWEGDNLAMTTWTDREGEVCGQVDYNRFLLDPATVGKLVGMLRSVLDRGLADPGLRLSQLHPRVDA